MTNSNFSKIIEDMNEAHIEKLIELLFLVTKKIENSSKNNNIETLDLIKKNILMINLLGEKSKIFSMERMQTKNELQQYL